VIALVVLVALIALLAWVVPVIAATVTRNVISSFDRSPSSGSIDQSVVEARLGRIEEAIDAMAVQIERLSDHQRALLGPASRASGDEEGNRLGTETPR
jgi:predicted PurR-regulated permease PerM